MTSIGNSAFSGCSSLTSITIPESVTSIGDDAFRYCYKLAEVYDLTGSDGLNITAGSANNGYVGYYAVEIKKEEGLTGIYYTEDNNEFVMYKDLEENHYLVDYKGQGVDITLPTFDDGRTYSIKRYAFYKNLTITSIEIPRSVTSIGDFAFRGCSSLETVDFEESSMLTSIGEEVFYYCSSLTSIIIPSSVTSIGNSAFEDCSSLETISFEDNSMLTSIGDSAFRNCSSLTSITIPNSVTSICSNLETINFEENSMLTSIGGSAFSNCSSLTSITIPNSVTSIGSFAFQGCSGLETVNFEDNSMLTSIGSFAFQGCSSLEIVNFGDNSKLTSIGSNAFEYCGSLETVNFGENSMLTSIGYAAFNCCSSLTSIIIPSSVMSIRGSAFSYCYHLTIYCEVESKPSGWSSGWSDSSRPVYWAGKWKYDEVTGEPRPI